MEKLDIILSVFVLLAIVGTAVYMLTQKKTEKSKGDGPVLRPEDDVQQNPTSSLN